MNTERVSSGQHTTAGWIADQLNSIRNEQALTFEFHGKSSEFFRI